MSERNDLTEHDILRRPSAWQDAILDSADFIIISTDLNGTIVTCNAGTLKKLGYSEEEIIGKTPLVFHDPEEGQERVEKYSAELHCDVSPQEVFTIRTKKGISPDESDWTYICKDGRRFIGNVCVTAIHDNNGTVVGFLKIGKDVTEQRKIEKALRDSEHRFQCFMDNSPALSTIKDSEGKYIFVNQRFLNEFQKRREEVIGKTIHDLLPAKAADILRSHDEVVMQNGQYLSFEETVDMPDGNTKTGLCFRFPLKDGSDNYHLGSVTIDITQRKYYEKQLEDYQIRLESAIAQLERLASTDTLSGLKNKGSFLMRLDEEIVRARRYELPLSLVLLDVDKFKEYNDSFGHPAGDAILIQIATLLTAHARPGDFVARIGGEEFAVILSNTPAQGAFIVGERLRRAVENSPWENRKVTISVGVTEVTALHPDGAAVYEAADKALYQAKHNGRNQVAQSV